MVSSFAVHYRNERTLRELLRIHPDEHPVVGPAVRPRPRRDGVGRRARRRRRRRPDRHQHGLPGAEGLQDRRGRGAARATPTRASRSRARPRAGSGLPVTVKLRSGQRPGDLRGIEVARRLAFEGGRRRDRDPSAPRLPAPQGRARLRARAAAGRGAAGAGADLRRPAHRRAGARGVRADRRRRRCCWRAARSATRGCSSSCSASRSGEPSRDEILAELDWVIGLRRRASRRRARGALPAQVLPVVRRAARFRVPRAARRDPGDAGGVADARRRWRLRRRCWAARAVLDALSTA